MQSGRQHPERDGPAQALRGQLLGDERRPEELVLQPVTAGLGDLLARRCRAGARGPEVGCVGVATATQVEAIASVTRATLRSLHGQTGRVALWRARHRRGVWPRGVWPRRLAQRGGPLRGRPRQVAPRLPAAQGVGRALPCGLGLRPRRPREGRCAARRRAGRRDERRQHQHPHRAHRPGDLQDPQRGGPDLRPAAGRDLPAARHPHRGHGHLDHRPGAPPPAARRRRARLVRRRRGASRWWTAPCPRPGPAGR